MNNTDKEYFRLLDTILTKGRVKKNRTGIDTIGVFGEQAKFEVFLDAFPILTTKKVWFKGIVHELLWFISGNTNIKYLVDNDVHIWDEWAYKRYKDFCLKPPFAFSPENVCTQDVFIQKIKDDAEFANQWGELGYGTYGSTWTAFEVPPIPIEITPRIKERESTYDYCINSPKTFHTGVVKDDFCGKTITTKKSRTLTVIGREPNDMYGRPVYIVQFDKTGYTAIARKDAILNNRVGDPYYPSVAGVGFIGGYKIETDLDRNLYKVWSHMLDRCYNKKCKEYDFYAKKGIFVCNRWFSFERFVEDVQRLPNWREKKIAPKNYQLDKDYYHSNCYSPDTCTWLLNSENRKYQKKNFKQSRLPLPINQLQKVIDKLKTNPDDRRMIVSAWHPYWVDHCVLPPCHCFFQFNTEELTIEERHKLYCNAARGDYRLSIKYLGTTDSEANKCYDDNNIPKRRLNLLLLQRSIDSFLGLSFNITSYSLLLTMIAQCVNMAPGTFTHTYGDLHIYKNHMEQVKEQLSRIPRELPKLWLNPQIKSLFDFKYWDIRLFGYDPHPAIKGQVAI
jgi:thymidylate synthase